MKKENGFTLTEMIIVLAMVGVLASIVIPSFRTTLQNNRVTTQANSLIAAFNLARSEAIKRGAAISVCSADPTTYAAPSSIADYCNDNNWAKGWVVIDANANLIRQWGALSGGTTVAATANSITYSGTGISNAAAVDTFDLTIPDCVGDQVRSISLSATGRPSTVRTACP